MRNLLLSAALAMTPVLASAQDDSPGAFADYDAYASFVTDAMARGEVLDILGRMTDLDQLNVGQRAQLEEQMAERWPGTYPNSDLMKDEKLGNFSREIRAFWTDQSRYGFFYAYLHHLPEGGVQVVHFGVSGDVNEIFKAF